jgi:hypothetical protein
VFVLVGALFGARLLAMTLHNQIACTLIRTAIISEIYRSTWWLIIQSSEKLAKLITAQIEILLTHKITPKKVRNIK